MAAVDEFIKQVHSQGLMRGNRYTVKMYPPLALLIGQDDKALERFAKSVSLPGRGIETLERSEFGETKTIGLGHSHNECTINFYLSEDAREKRYIERWQDLVFNPVQQKYGYYRDYVGKIEIEILSHNNKKKAKYELQEVFPTDIGGIEMEWGDGTAKELSVTFKYRRYLKTD